MKQIGVVVVMLLAAWLLTACTGLRQINQLAIVSAVGLNVGEQPGSVKLSVQIVRPADARGQTGAPAGGTGGPIYSVSAEGRTIFEAIRNLGRFTSRRVYWAHNFLIVMHEDYARRGIAGMVDFFTRNHELRMNIWVAVTSDKPEELISTVTGLEVVPGEAVDRLFRDNHVVGLAPGTNMIYLEEAFLSLSTEPVIARLQLKDRGISNKKPEEHGSIKQVELAGAAAFKRDKMIGWLSPKETRGLLFFLEKLDRGVPPGIYCENVPQLQEIGVILPLRYSEHLRFWISDAAPLALQYVCEFLPKAHRNRSPQHPHGQSAGFEIAVASNRKNLGRFFL